MNQLPWLILWIPFLAAATIFFFTIKHPKLSGWLATGGIFISFILSLILVLRIEGIGFFRLGGETLPLQSSISWMNVGVPIEFGVLVNGLSLLMLLIVTGVGSLIFLYSMSYMEHDSAASRYFAALSLFAFSMLGIVLSNNFIQIFIFWELVGLSSYLLIGFWFEKPEAATAGKKAFITTRVGDVGMMIGILMLFGFLASQGHGTFNFIELEHWLKGIGPPGLGREALSPSASSTGLMTAVCLLIFMGVAGKSAQMPLHVWLPDAMEGPTPVSALLHSSTMVVAGVFLLARLNFLFVTSPLAMNCIAVTGIATTLLMGVLAFFQNDIKKILAYSTLSQLGLMILSIGLGNTEAGIFHLTTHAFFKALLFLAAGSFIHAFHTQDIDEISDRAGGLSLFTKMPLTSISFTIGAASLAGLPFLASLHSKDLILESVLEHSPMNKLFTTILFLTPTYFYTIRLIFKIFLGKTRRDSEAHESEWKMALPLAILALFCFDPIFKMTFSNFFKNIHETKIPVTHGLILISVVICYFFSRGKYLKTPSFFSKKYFFDDVYDTVVIKGIQENLGKISNEFEKTVIVEGEVNGTARLVRKFGDLLRRFQTGVVQFYAFIFTLGITAMIFLLLMVGR